MNVLLKCVKPVIHQLSKAFETKRAVHHTKVLHKPHDELADVTQIEDPCWLPWYCLQIK